MALGYEGYIQVGGSVVLGTGGATPRNRTRLDSSSGYAGEISGGSMGIGYPHVYDWSSWDGSADVEMTDGLFSVLKTWIVSNRDQTRDVVLSSRNTNNQTFNGYWNSISFAASVGALVTSTIGFVSIERDGYAYGSDTQSKSGITDSVLVPIPYWKTAVGGYKFLDWSLDFSQDVVKIFACRRSATALEPAYLGVSPMTISLSGTYLFSGEMADSSSLTVTIGSGSFNLTKVELQTTSDAVQNHNSLTPIAVTLAAYGVT
jgi:hypothetical protein